MMAWKAWYFGDEQRLQSILKSSKPKGMKQIGKQVSGYNGEDWDWVKEAIVISGNYAKFTSSADMKEALLSTGDRELVEASPVDGIWGINCSAARAVDRRNWNGQNLLGKALMEVRRMIREEQKKQHADVAS
jgi:ribA/ribD-fused uncharacterized protein